jgi:5-methylcytosine-specific restriction endonuclease McrA
VTKPGDPRNTSRWRKLRREVLASEDTCHICGNPVDVTLPHRDPWAPQVDHIVPIWVDPTLALERSNVRLSHFRCNRARDNRTNGVPLAVPVAASAPYTPTHHHPHSRTWAPDHPAGADCPTCRAHCQAWCGAATRPGR